MKLGIIIFLDSPDDLFSPAILSLQEGVHCHWSDFIRVFLIRSSYFLPAYNPLQVGRLQEVEELCSHDYSGTVFVDASYPEVLQQVGIIFPKDPVSTISLNHTIGFEPVRALLSHAWSEEANASLMSSISSPLSDPDQRFHSQDFSSDINRYFDLDVFAVLRDLSLSTFNLISPGSIVADMASDLLVLTSEANLGFSDQLLIADWLLLGRRVKLVNHSIFKSHPFPWSQAGLPSNLPKKETLLSCLSVMRCKSNNSLYDILLSVISEAISGLDSAHYHKLQLGDICLESSRALFNSLKKSLIRHLEDSGQFQDLAPNEGGSDLPSLMYAGYFRYASRLNHQSQGTHSDGTNSLVSHLLDPPLASAIQDGFETLLQNGTGTLSNPSTVPWSLESSTIAFRNWICLSDLVTDTHCVHSAVFFISVSRGQLVSIKLLAAPNTLHRITIRIPAQCFGEKICTNIDLITGDSTHSAGCSVKVGVVEVAPRVWSIELAAIAHDDYSGLVHLCTCHEDSSIYMASKSKSIFFSCVEYSLASSDSRATRPVTSFAANNSSLSSVAIDSSCHLPFVYEPAIHPGQDSIDVCIRLASAAATGGLVCCETSNYSRYTFSSVVTQATIDSSPSFSFVSETHTEEGHPSPCGPTARSARFTLLHGQKSLTLRFAATRASGQLPGLGRCLLISHLTILIDEWEIRDSMLSSDNDSICRDTPLISVISVAYKMHHLVPGWLSNYAMQSIHDLGGNAVELMIADIDLSLPLLVYVHAFGALHGLRVALIPFNDDPGLYGCWNQMIQNSQSKYISNFNPDDRKLPDHLASLCYILDQTGAQAAATACHVLRFEDGDSIPVSPSDIRAQDETWWKGKAATPTLSVLTAHRLYREPSPGHYLPNNMLHSMPVWQRSLHSHHGFFDEAVHGTYADYAFWITVLSAGERAVFLDAPLYLFSVIRGSHNRVNASQRFLDKLLTAARLSSQRVS